MLAAGHLLRTLGGGALPSCPRSGNYYSSPARLIAMWAYRMRRTAGKCCRASRIRIGNRPGLVSMPTSMRHRFLKTRKIAASRALPRNRNGGLRQRRFALNAGALFPEAQRTYFRSEYPHRFEAKLRIGEQQALQLCPTHKCNFGILDSPCRKAVIRLPNGRG